MNQQEFDDYVAQGYNRIPVTREVLADTETPLTSYLKLAKGPYSYLLESVQGGEKWGRYSIIGLPAKQRLQVYGNQLQILRGEEVEEAHELDNPLTFVEGFIERFKVPDISGLPKFAGGLVGYFGYDSVRYVYPKLKAGTPEDVLHTPDVCLTVSDEVLVFDNLQGKLHLIVHAEAEADDALVKANARLDELEEGLCNNSYSLPTISMTSASKKTESEFQFESSFGEEGFKQSVERIKDYVLSGDTMQVVLSQRLSLDFDAEPLNLYRALRCLNPSPYMYFMDMGDHQVVGSSPEILARLEEGLVTVRPIAGTRRRGMSEEEDKALEQDLINDPKEIAEHLMLIDLGRNDVGRIAKVGSVELTEKMMVERFSHVMHITSNVTGMIDGEKNAIDVLEATLPAGTLSGAPKVRAMEIIDELEPEKRGIYGGAIGYISWSGNMDTAIAIRTAVIKDGKLYVQAGAGVVADSVPELEWKETMNKARAIFNAADWVIKGSRES